MTLINHTHDPAARSWVSTANGHAEFAIQNLPYAEFRPRAGASAGRNGH